MLNRFKITGHSLHIAELKKTVAGVRFIGTHSTYPFFRHEDNFSFPRVKRNREDCLKTGESKIDEDFLFLEQKCQTP